MPESLRFGTPSGARPSRNFLLLASCSQEAAELRPPAEPVDIGGLSRYDRPQPTLNDYDQLLRKWPETAVIQ